MALLRLHRWIKKPKHSPQVGKRIESKTMANISRIFPFLIVNDNIVANNINNINNLAVFLSARSFTV